MRLRPGSADPTVARFTSIGFKASPAGPCSSSRRARSHPNQASSVICGESDRLARRDSVVVVPQGERPMSSNSGIGVPPAYLGPGYRVRTSRSSYAVDFTKPSRHSLTRVLRTHPARRCPPSSGPPRRCHFGFQCATTGLQPAQRTLLLSRKRHRNFWGAQLSEAVEPSGVEPLAKSWSPSTSAQFLPRSTLVTSLLCPPRFAVGSHFSPVRCRGHLWLREPTRLTFDFDMPARVAVTERTTGEERRDSCRSGSQTSRPRSGDDPRHHRASDEEVVAM